MNNLKSIPRETFLRLIIQNYIDDGAKCEHCGHVYSSYEDFVKRNPIRGLEEKMSFVDSDCWNEYSKDYIGEQKRVSTFLK